MADATPSKPTVACWADPAEILAAAELRGEVVYQAPAAPLRPTRAARRARPPEPPSLGLPFGVHLDGAGRLTCWSCGRELQEHEAVPAGPGDARCPGCGARLPFVE